MINFLQTKWSSKGAIALAISATLLGACTNDLDQQAGVPETNVTTEEVADNTNELIGKTVTIRSTPVNKLGPSTFTIADKQFFGSESILVVNASGKTFTLPTDPNTPIQATGPVSKFVIADINRDYNLGLDPNLYKEYETKPAIIAQSIIIWRTKLFSPHLRPIWVKFANPNVATPDSLVSLTSLFGPKS